MRWDSHGGCVEMMGKHVVAHPCIKSICSSLYEVCKGQGEKGGKVWYRENQRRYGWGFESGTVKLGFNPA